MIIVPKVKRAEDVRWVDVLLTQIETKLRRARRIGLEVLIEEVEAMINAAEIARATPRLEALLFGPGDFYNSAWHFFDLLAPNPEEIEPTEGISDQQV